MQTAPDNTLLAEPATLEDTKLNPSLTHNPDEQADLSPSLLAWAGWQLEMPGDWRPLKMTGTPAKGWMIVGDAMCALFSIHWEHPRRSFPSDGDQWVQQRLKRKGLTPDPAPPAASRFSACTWAHGVQSEEDKQTTYWYGYAKSAQLLLGIKVNGVLPEEQRAQVTDHVLPTLRTSPAESESTWAMHDVSFVAPAGFELQQKHLFTGDVALEFRKGRETLLLRQVYPGDLALGRRSFKLWLSSYPFTEHRRLRNKRATFEPWSAPKLPQVTGIRRLGRKRLGFPLGMIASRHTHALAVHDQTLNRLLIAEHMAGTETDRAVCETAITRMNLPLRECN